MNKFIAFALILALASCAGGGDNSDAKKEKAESKAAAKEMKTDDLICPQVAIIKQAEEVTDFGGSNGNPQSFSTKARMTKVKGNCGYHKDGIDVLFELTMIAEAGARSKNPQFNLPYFVAIVDPVDNVISKRSVMASFDFSKDKVAEVSDSLHVFIPLDKSSLLAGPDYRVVVGFDLSGHKPDLGGSR